MREFDFLAKKWHHSLMKSDKNTYIQELRDAIEKFKKERDWKQFHNPKDLAEILNLA